MIGAAGDKQLSAGNAESSRSSPVSYTGEVVYIFAYDVAYEISRQRIVELLGHPVAEFAVDASKRGPRQLFFYRPRMVRLPPQERIGPSGRVTVKTVVKLLPLGAISITVHVPFEVPAIEDLVDYHDLQFNNGSLHEEVRRLADELRRELAPYCVRPSNHLVDEEAYTVFCIKSPALAGDNPPFNAERWWRENRRAVASLLTQETEQDNLSHQEAQESTDRYLSYYQHDLVVVD